MLYEYSVKISLPVPVVYETMRDCFDKFTTYLPNIVHIKILERKDRGRKTTITSKGQGRYILPEIIGLMIKAPDMAWITTSEWLNDEYTCSWEYQPFIFRDYIKVTGTDTFTADGKGTRVTTKGNIYVNFMHYPLIPSLLKQKINGQISDIVMNLVKPNFFAVYDALEKYVKDNPPVSKPGKRT